MKRTCINCGQCCSNLLLLSQQEEQRIKKYIKEHDIFPINIQNALTEYKDICPFRDNKNNKCVIYEVRPAICRDFACYNNERNINNFSNFKTKNMLKTFYPKQYCADTSWLEKQFDKNIKKFTIKKNRKG